MFLEMSILFAGGDPTLPGTLALGPTNSSSLISEVAMSRPLTSQVSIRGFWPKLQLWGFFRCFFLKVSEVGSPVGRRSTWTW